VKSNKPVKQQHHQQTAVHIEQHHIGPLPSPLSFEQYNNALPGAAERIMIMAEIEQKHRHSLELAEAANRNTMMKERSRGQWMAYSIALVLPCLGASLIFSGFSITGTILGAAGIIPVIYAFVPSKKHGA
jgi:uncharacterized membrane protein